MPKGITIMDCKISAPGTQAFGVFASSSDLLSILDSLIESVNSTAMVVGKNAVLVNTTASGKRALDASAPSDSLFVFGCVFDGDDIGVFIANTNAINIEVRDCTIRSQLLALHTDSLKNPVLFSGNLIVADGNTGGTVKAVRHDIATSDPTIVHIGDRIIAINRGTGNAEAIAPEPIAQRYVDCSISAETTNANGGAAVGLSFAPGPGGGDFLQEVIGGSIHAQSANEKQTRVYAIEVTSPTPNVRVKDAVTSEIFGPILPAGLPSSMVQQVVNVAEASPSAVLNNEPLDLTEKTVNLSVTFDAVRAVTVTGDTAGMTGDVYVIGEARREVGDENFRFTDKISLNGTQTVEGKKAFRRITKVILPPGSSGERVSVGTSNKLGLAAPLSQKSDFLQYRRRVGNVYEVQSAIPESDIDTNHHTVKIPLSGVGNDLELVYVTV